MSCKRDHYDIIIAGGGTAGCVLATRLSELPDLSILLLEAGVNRNDDPRVQIPALFSQSYGDPTADYDYKTVPQSELNGKIVGHARGKGLGGSSLINLLGLIYPSKSGFDAWAEMGNPGWDWESLLPYLKKFQTFHMPNEKVQADLGLQYIDPTAQGLTGPIQASYHSNADPLDKAWFETFRNMGYSITGDTMSGRNVGGYNIVSAVDPKTRTRSHAGNAYLDQARDRPNLEIVTDANVNKVVFKDKVATGVEFNGRTVAGTDIILCAGAFGSPGILERSGIGGQHLKDPISLNENVGEGLQDHVMCGVSFEVNDGVETLDSLRDPAKVKAAMEQYQKDLSGPMASTCVSFAYMPLLEEDPKLIDQYPPTDYASEFTHRLLKDRTEASCNMCFVLGQANFDAVTMKDLFTLVQPESYVTIFTALAHPLSRGSVHCTTMDPDAPPQIDPAYYTHPLDVELTRRHLRIFDKIIQTEPMKSIVKSGGKRIPADAKLDSLEDTEKLVRQAFVSNQHPCGTCAMLPRDKGGVVDSKLRVYGVSRLRVCDASVMPLITRSNIMTTVYTIAEKAADMIKQEWTVESGGGKR